MNSLKYTSLLFLFMIMFSSCYDEDYSLEDDTTTDGDHYPVIQSLSLSGTSAPDSTVSLMMHYWSEDDIQEQDLYISINGADETLYASAPTAITYDTTTTTNVAEFDYIISSSADLPTDTTSIAFRIEIVNVNQLTAETSTSITVIR